LKVKFSASEENPLTERSGVIISANR